MQIYWMGKRGAQAHWTCYALSNDSMEDLWVSSTISSQLVQCDFLLTAELSSSLFAFRWAVSSERRWQHHYMCLLRFILQGRHSCRFREADMEVIHLLAKSDTASGTREQRLGWLAVSLSFT